MTQALLHSLSVSLTLTLLLELGFALVWGLRRRELLLVALMNLMTNPAAVTVHFLLTSYAGLGYWWSALPIELAVFAAESLCCKGFVKHPWRFSLLLNSCSYCTGLLLQTII